MDRKQVPSLWQCALCFVLSSIYQWVCFENWPSAPNLLGYVYWLEHFDVTVGCSWRLKIGIDSLDTTGWKWQDFFVNFVWTDEKLEVSLGNIFCFFKSSGYVGFEVCDCCRLYIYIFVVRRGCWVNRESFAHVDYRTGHNYSYPRGQKWRQVFSLDDRNHQFVLSLSLSLSLSLFLSLSLSLSLS